MKLKGRDFLTLLDYTPEEIAYSDIRCFCVPHTS